MIDFHTHILPDIDDGAGSVEESVRMIEMLCEQGVRKILLTPHFYAYMSSSESFVEKRKRALEKLLKALGDKKPEVEIYLGGEVLFFDELWRLKEIKDFCISGTDYILIEMPFSSWENNMVESVINLFSRGVVPVIAHFERYLKYKGNQTKIRELVNAGALLQMNCQYMNKFFTRSKAIRYIKNGEVFALGSDCHNISGRKPDFENIDKLLKNKLNDRQYDKFISRQEKILRKATKVYPAQ